MNFSSWLAYPLEQIPYVLIALLLSFAIHEYSHAIMAYAFGDATAKNEGRLTLNPLAHLDIIGTLLIFFAGFGWAKPVPINRSNFRHPRLAGVLVSVAGPLSNLLIAFLFMLAWYLINGFGWISWFSSKNYDHFFQLFDTIIYLNLVLFFFNLLPFPPLDGYHITFDLLPRRAQAVLMRYQSYAVLLLLLVVFTPLGDYLFPPLFHGVIPYVMDQMGSMLAPLWK